MEQIAHKSGTAAAVLCRTFQSLNNKQQIGFMDKILGVVACLGIVSTDKLSRYRYYSIASVMCKFILFVTWVSFKNYLMIEIDTNYQILL